MTFSRAAGVVLLAVFALPGSALATDRFAKPTGSDVGDCSNAANPCKAIGYALLKSASGDRIFVSTGTYLENVSVPAGRTLLSARSASPTIDGGAGTAVTVTGAGATVQGFHLRGDTHGLLVNGTASSTKVTSNTFDDTAATTGGKLAIDAGSATIAHNIFQMPLGDATTTYGILANTDKPLDISSNTFANLFTSIYLGAGVGTGRTITGNTLTGIHGKSGSPGLGVFLTGSATIAGNTLFANPSVYGAYGLYLLDFSVPATVVTQRNRISGLPNSGIYTGFLKAGSTLKSEGDVSTDNVFGLEIFGGSVTVSGATLYDNHNYEIYLGSANGAFTLTSSIVGDKGISSAGVPCAISYSRGPTLGPGSCKTFQTTAAPAFAAPGDYHLTTASPLIDAGDPSPPPAGATDIDGHARATVGRLAGRCLAPLRDMGAYEFAPKPAFVCPPPVKPPDTQAPKLSKVSIPRRIVTGSRVRIRFTLSEKARVTLRFRRSVAGIKSGSRCVAVPRHRPRNARRCTRLLKGGTLAVNGKAGLNRPVVRVKFGRSLPRPGAYRVDLVATDAARNVSHAVRAATRIKPVPRRHRH